MGLGIITGGIAIAMMATAWQIKSDELPWVGVPNAMTRIFEVNIEGLPWQCVRVSFFNISIPHLPHRDVENGPKAPD